MRIYNINKYSIRFCRKVTAVAATCLFIVTVFSGCYFFPKEEDVLAPPIKAPEKVVYNTVEVKKGTIERSIQATGVFVSVGQQDLFYRDGGGRIKAINIQLGDSVEKGDIIIELETGDLLNKIKYQEINLKRAQITFEQVKEEVERGDANKYQLELAELDVKSNQLELDDLKTELTNSRLASPANGRIVYLRDLKLGDTVDTFQTLATIADPDRLMIAYSGDNAGDFKIGMNADIGFNNADYKGVVVTDPTTIPRDASDDEQRAVWFKLDETPKGAVIGAPVTINVVLEKKEDVIVLSKSLVKSFSGRKFVNVLKDDIREERDVEIGLQTATEVEIVKGLEVGEKIITN